MSQRAKKLYSRLLQLLTRTTLLPPSGRDSYTELISDVSVVRPVGKFSVVGAPRRKILRRRSLSCCGLFVLKNFASKDSSSQVVSCRCSCATENFVRALVLIVQLAVLFGADVLLLTPGPPHPVGGCLGPSPP